MQEYAEDGVPLIEMSLPVDDNGRRIVHPDMMWGDVPWLEAKIKLVAVFRRYVEERFSTLELDTIYDKKIKGKFELNGRSVHEMSVLGLIKGVWKMMRTLRTELKSHGRKWMKMYYYPLAGSLCGIHYREEGIGGPFLKATRAKHVYKSWYMDWSDLNIKRQHHFWDHLLQSKIGWEGEVLAYLMKEMQLVFDKAALERFEASNIIGQTAAGLPIKRKGPKQKNTIVAPFKKQQKDQRDYMRLTNIKNRDFKRNAGRKGNTGKMGEALKKCLREIVEDNEIKIGMRPENIYKEEVANNKTR